MKSVAEIFEFENYQKKCRNFHWNLYENENFRDRKFSIFNWIFNENFDDNFRNFSISKFLVGRFQNAPIFFVINRFGRDFFQSCVDFHGGDDGIEIREI